MSDHQSELEFDIDAFMDDFRRAATRRGYTIQGAAREIGVNGASMTRYQSARYNPQAPQLAAMSRWAGLNPANYVIQFGERLLGSSA